MPSVHCQFGEKAADPLGMPLNSEGGEFLRGGPERLRGRISIYAAFDALMKKRYP